MPFEAADESLKFFSLQNSVGNMTEDMQDHSNSESLFQGGTMQQWPYCRLPTTVSNGLTLLLCSRPCWVPSAARQQLISIHLTLSTTVQGAVVLLTQMSIASRGRQAPPSPLPGCAQKRLHIAKAFQPISWGSTLFLIFLTSPKLCK